MTCGNTNPWSKSDLTCLLQDTRDGRVDIAIGDDLTSLDRERSWILDDVTIHAYKSCDNTSGTCDSRYMDFASLGYSYYEPIYKVVNCQTPTGTRWSATYDGRYH